MGAQTLMLQKPCKKNTTITYMTPVDDKCVWENHTVIPSLLANCHTWEHCEALRGAWHKHTVKLVQEIVQKHRGPSFLAWASQCACITLHNMLIYVNLEHLNARITAEWKWWFKVKNFKLVFFFTGVVFVAIMFIFILGGSIPLRTSKKKILTPLFLITMS